MQKLKRSECAVLPLVLKGKWYDLINAGVKKEEYRDKTPYWSVRLKNWFKRQDLWHAPIIEFRRGYAREAARMAFLSDGPRAKNGFVAAYCIKRIGLRQDWGEPIGEHYVIPLGERITLEG